MANQLNIQVGADVSGAITGLTQLESKTSQAFAKVKQSSGAAQQTVLNFGRVIQDAPYAVIAGNIGAIANNIDPLIESFGRAKAQGGGFVGALKSIGSSLIGPAGIGLAVSLVTSSLVLWGDQIFGTTKKSKEYTDAIDSLALQKKILAGETLNASEAEKVQTSELQKQSEEVKKLNQALAESSKTYQQRRIEATGSVQEEISLVSSLALVVQNQSLTYEQRNNALTKLKSINQTYFGDLSLEASSLITLTKRVQEYTNALIAQEVVKGYTKDIANLTIANNKQSQTLEQLITQQDQLKKKLAITPKEVDYVETMNDGMGRLSIRTKIVNDEYRNTERELVNINQQISDQKAIIDKGSQSVAKLTKDLNGAVIEASKFKSPEIKPVKPKVAKDRTNEIINEAKRLAKELEKAFEGQIVLPQFSETQTKTQQLAIAKKIIGDFKASRIELKIPLVIDNDKIDVPPLLEGGVTRTEAERAAERDGAILGLSFNKGVNDALKTGLEVSPENLAFRKFADAYEQTQQRIAEINKQISESLTNVRTEAITQFAESIGKAFSTGDLSNIFKGFVDTIAGGVVSIGKQMIALGLKAVVLKNALKSLFANPAAMIAAGVGLVAVGSAIRGALSKGIEGREKGGPVMGNTPYIVGERGPELFVPSVSGSIIPNNQLGAFNGRPAFAMAGSGGRSIVRGTDILLASARSQRSINRING